MKKGVKTIIAGSGLVILAILVVPLIILGFLASQKSGSAQFKVPGSMEAKADTPGRYYLWHDFETVYNGKNYHYSKDLPNGMEIKLTGPDGTAFQLISDASITLTSNGNSKHAIGYIEVNHPGKVKINVTGGDSAERIFSFGRSEMLQTFGVVFGGGILCVFLAFVGIGIGIWGLVKLTRAGT